MAKGGGGEGHFDERRRATAAKPPLTYKADSPEVLAAIEKPRAKPVVVVKKKPKLLPMAPPRKLAQAVPGLRMGAAQAEVRVGDLPRKQDLGPFDDQIVTSSLKSNRAPTVTSGNWRPGGSGRALLDWVKRRTTMKNLDT
jgi:hypothetical protein